MTMPQKPIPPVKIADLLQKYNLRPKKGLGQNFLIDETALQKIVTAADITNDDLVLEIGPGLGSLTRHLAVAAGYVVSVEIDRNLIPPLQETLKTHNNVNIIQGDILSLDIEQALSPTQLKKKLPDYTVVANIPYNITSALIRHLLEAAIKPSRMVLTIQYEVAMRICAHPPNLSLLALSVQVYGEPQVMHKIPAGAFYPSPKVDSAILRLRLYPHPLIPPSHLNTFFHLAKAGFSQKRKTLRNSLSAGLRMTKLEVEKMLLKHNIDPGRRAQTLDIEEWKDLTLSFDKQ